MLIGFDASRAFVAEATGTENYSRSLLKALAKVDRKNRYRVYLRSVGWWDGRMVGKIKAQSPKNFEFRLIRPSRLWTQAGLALETWRNPVDLLFIPAHTLPALRNPKIKTVVTIHDLGVEFLPGYHQFPQRYYLDFASRYAARYADAIIAVSAATKRDLINRYKVAAEKVFVVSEGVDRAFFKRQSRSKVESVKSKYKINGDYILFVGTVQPRKNLQMLIQAFSKLVKTGPVSSFLPVSARSGQKSNVSGGDQADLRAVGIPSRTAIRLHALTLVIAGKLGWDYDEILVLPQKLGIGDRVKFLGHVPDADLPALYSGAVVFAFPSLFEGFGLPILEAISCGCPGVASDIGPHREILRKLIAGPARLYPRPTSSLQSNLAMGIHNSLAAAGARRGSPAPVTRNQLVTTNYELITNSVPMTLVKPTNVDKWVDVLYQYISQYEKRSTFSIHKFLNPDLFSWEQAAIATLQVFDKTLS